MKASKGYDDVGYFERIKERPFRPTTDEQRCDITGSLGPLAFLQVAQREDGQLNVVDFGGGLGGTFERCKAFLPTGTTWRVIEQPGVIEAARSASVDPQVSFSDSLVQVLSTTPPNVVIFSTVLQYLERPEQYIQMVENAGVRWIVVDRTPLWLGGRNRIVVQKVPAKYYTGSMPARVFDRGSFLKMFTYPLIATFEDLGSIPIDRRHTAKFLGFVFKRP